MAFQLGDNEDQGMNEINLIPLIDIMLVLMIIFLVTATVLKPSVPLSLPKTSATVNQQPKSLQISIDKTGQVFWEGDKVSLTVLADKLKDAKSTAQNTQQTSPSISIRADKAAQYDTIAKVLASASQAGLTDIAFVSDAE